MVIKRYLSDDNLRRMKDELRFLIDYVNDYRDEWNLFLREDYFNLYYQGNSMAKIAFKPEGKYEVTINRRFFDSDDSGRFTEKSAATAYGSLLIRGNQNSSYLTFLGDRREIRGLLQKKSLQELARNIKRIGYSGELIFEQALISDNRDREDLIIIDRQVTDHKHRGRIDVLALRQVESNHYKFVVIEAKLGNNPQLSGTVAVQLEGYINHIKRYIDDYKNCYEENYRQCRQLGLYGDRKPDQIAIDPEVEGLVVVAGFSKLAEKSIEHLRATHKNIKVKSFCYKLELDKIWSEQTSC